MDGKGKLIAIVDYGMGNLRSVYNVFKAIGQEATVVNDPAALKNYKAIVLPGVGAFGDAMNNLRHSRLLDVLNEEIIQKEKPFLGICLGIQLIADTSFEHGEHKGLGWIPGTVERFPDVNQGKPLRIPHMGWNDVKFTNKSGLFSDLGDSQTFYFVHSYRLIPKGQDVVSGITYYGGEFAAAVEYKNICATQFHPEKSQEAGFSVVKNWCTRNAKCLKPV